MATRIVSVETVLVYNLGGATFITGENMVLL